MKPLMLIVVVLSLIIFSCSSTLKYAVTYQFQKNDILITKNTVYTTGRRIKDFDSFEEMRIFLQKGNKADNCIVLFFTKL